MGTKIGAIVTKDWNMQPKKKQTNINIQDNLALPEARNPTVIGPEKRNLDEEENDHKIVIMGMFKCHKEDLSKRTQ